MKEREQWAEEGKKARACGGEAFDLRKVTAGEQKVLRRGVGVTHRWSYAIVTQESDFSPWCLSMLEHPLCSIVLVRALRGIIYLYICINVSKGKAAALYSQFTLFIDHRFHRNMLQRKAILNQWAGGLLLFYFVLCYILKSADKCVLPRELPQRANASLEYGCHLWEN